jgi:hypothetical protein
VRRFAIAGLTIAIFAGAGAEAANAPPFAAPAHFTSTRIAEGASIGGVAIGMTKKKAVSVWGKPDGVCRRADPYNPDDRRRTCTYGEFVKVRGGKESTGAGSYAGFGVTPEGKVVSVYVRAAKPAINDRALQRAYERAYARVRGLKTGRAIRVRSTMEAARHAYGIPTPVNIPYGHESDFLRTVIVRGATTCTTFSSNGSKPLFTYIEVIQVITSAYCPPDPD